MKELGYERVDGTVWYGLLAPARTPKHVIERLNAESRRVLAMQDVKEKLNRAGIDAAGRNAGRVRQLHSRRVREVGTRREGGRC